jgi:PAS domain S-box-containing protein
VIRDITALKQKEQEVQRERSIINSLFDSVPGVIAIFNENLEMVRWNAKAMGQLGYSVEELQNKPALSFMEEQYYASIELFVGKIRSFGFGEVETTLKQKNGETKQFYLSGTQTDINGQLFFVIYGIDISERKKENETLRQIEQQFQNVYNMSPDMVGVTRIADGRILTANPASEKLSGHTKEEFLGRTTFEMGWWANPSDRATMLNLIAQNGEVLNHEFQMGTKDKGILTCTFSARPIVYDNEKCILFVVHDITERKNNETLLRNNQDRLQKAQVLGQLGYSEQIMGDDNIWVSAEGKRIFGFEPVDGFIALNDALNCIDSPDLLLSTTKKQIEEGTRYDIEFQIHPANGDAPKFIHAIQNIETDNTGKPYKLINTFQDITERKNIELEIRRINENLEKIVDERTKQLAMVNKDLEAFAYSVSHDLRAPIRHIDGFFKLLYGQIEHPTEQMMSYYDKISGASKRMSSMIDDLLSFSRLGRKEMLAMDVDMNVLVMEIVDSFRDELEARNIRWNIQPLPIVNGDKNLLKTAFENLIGNAIKYTRSKSQAIVDISSEMQPNGLVRISVTDNGVGFDMAYQGKLFGVFQRLHSNDEFEGTGIGLANVKQIVTRHGGKITAVGQVGEGATFVVDLPVSTQVC